MTANHAHTPMTQLMRERFKAAGHSDIEFMTWIAQVEAAAEQRGATRELRKFAHAQDTWCAEGRAEQRISRIAMRDALLDRADLLEGDDV